MCCHHLWTWSIWYIAMCTYLLQQLAVIECGTSNRFALYSCNAKSNSFHLKYIQIKHKNWNKSILLPVNLPCKLDLDLQSELRFTGVVGQGSGQPQNSSLNFEEVDCLFSETGLIFDNKISRVALRFVFKVNVLLQWWGLVISFLRPVCLQETGYKSGLVLHWHGIHQAMRFPGVWECYSTQGEWSGSEHSMICLDSSTDGTKSRAQQNPLFS